MKILQFVIKYTLALMFLFLGVLSCKKEAKEEISQDYEYAVTDSIHILSTKKLPNFFKSSINDNIFRKPSITARNSESLQEASEVYLEEKAYDVLSEEGITTYSVALKKEVRIEDIVKNPVVAEILSNYKSSCKEQQLSLGGDSVYPSHEVISMNSDGFNMGDPTYTHFVNYGTSIHVTHINLNTGFTNNTWTPNPISSNFHGGDFWNSVGDFFGGVFNGIWSGIRSIGRGIGGLFRSKCHCSGRRPSHSDFLTQDSCCNGGDMGGFNTNFSVILPTEFLEGAKNSKPLKDLDCDCLFGETPSGDNTPKEFLDQRSQAYFDCSCQNNNPKGVAHYLQLNTIETNYLENNKPIRDEVCKFISDNNYSKEAISFAKEAVKAVMVGGEVDFPNGIINYIQNPCGKKIVEEMKRSMEFKNLLKENNLGGGTHNFSEMMLDLFDKSQKTNLIFKEGNPSSSGANGSTLGTTITLDKNYLKKATTLAIARTIIHEMLHAYLNVLYSDPFSMNSLNFRLLMDKYASKNGYNNGDGNRFRHEFMGEYVDAMATSLQEWDKNYGTGGNLGWDYYRAMAFGGLFYDNNGIQEDTDSFKKLVPKKSDRNQIKKLIENEQNGNSYAKGKKCK